MRHQWIKQTGSDAVIVIFGGWALGPSPFLHLNGTQDILFVDDYQTIDALPDLSAYAHKSVCAFSFGVAAFAQMPMTDQQMFDQRVAINGSPTPYDRKQGIPPVIYDKTLEGLTDASFQSFLMLCFGAPQPHMAIDIAKRKAELAVVKDRTAPAMAPSFDRIWISSADKIFPPANLDRAWADQSKAIRKIDAPHVPFAMWDNWDEVLG